MSANPQIRNRNIYAAKSKLYYRNHGMIASNYSFFYQCKIFEDLKMAVTNIVVDTIHITKLRQFRFLNVINTTLTREMINILPIDSKIFFQKYVGLNIILKHNICAMQPSELSYEYKKTTSYIDMFHIRCNFC